MRDLVSGMRPAEMRSDAQRTDIAWLDRATHLCARIQDASSSDEIGLAKELGACLSVFENQPLSRFAFHSDLAVPADRANETISLAVIRSIRPHAGYMVSRGVEGEAIATIVCEEFCGEVTFTGKSEALALTGALLQGHIRAKAAQIDLDLNSQD